jgi:hypothetical protein
MHLKVIARTLSCIYISLALCLSVFSEVAFSEAQAQSSKAARLPERARDFVAMAPAELFYTEDEMSEEAKAKLVKGGFKRTKSFNCLAWGVASESRNRIVLQICSDSWVVVQLYHDTGSHKDKRVIVAVNSVRSSGRASDLELFSVSGDGDSFKPMSQQERAALGVESLTEDDFLANEERFPVGEALPVGLTVSESGELVGELQTWMDPRWESRRQLFENRFVWRGERFERVKTKAK